MRGVAVVVVMVVSPLLRGNSGNYPTLDKTTVLNIQTLDHKVTLYYIKTSDYQGKKIKYEIKAL